MERYVVLLFSLLFSVPSFAALPAGVPIRVMGGFGTNNAATVQVSASDTTRFTLFGGLTPAVTNDFYPFYKNGVAYQVTAGKTCRCDNITWASDAAANRAQLISATASFASGAGSITGGVHQGGAAAVYPMVFGGTANQWAPLGVVYEFAASTYAGWQASGANSYSFALSCFEY